MSQEPEPLDRAIDRVAARLTMPGTALDLMAVVAALPPRGRRFVVRPRLAAPLAAAAVLAALWLAVPRRPDPAPVPVVLETAGAPPFVTLVPPPERAAPATAGRDRAPGGRVPAVALDRHVALPPADRSRALPALDPPAALDLDAFAPLALGPPPAADVAPLTLDPLPLGARRPGSQEQER
ncbi:MAG: hypothetical protein AB7H88_11930 [Vicinamibacterales bacterium]